MRDVGWKSLRKSSLLAVNAVDYIKEGEGGIIES
jgi:hypothetical protein